MKSMSLQLSSALARALVLNIEFSLLFSSSSEPSHALQEDEQK
jgi:hypothetical protein